MKKQETTAAAWENMLPKAAAVYLQISESLLAKMRMPSDPRTGPKFVKIGRVVLYRRTDLDEWLAAHVVSAAA